MSSTEKEDKSGDQDVVSSGDHEKRQQQGGSAQGDGDVSPHSSSSAPPTITTDTSTKVEVKSIDDFPSTSKSLPTSRSIWNESIEYPALRVPVRETARIRQALKSAMWRHTGRPNIYPDPQKPKEYRILVLKQNQQQQQQQEDSNDDDDQLQRVIEQHKDIDIQKTTYTIDFTYDDYNVEQALRKVLPTSTLAAENTEIPSSFESVGPICHLNLRSQLAPYKYWIGKILLDKNQPRIQTVVTKIGTIANEYRTFGMEIIAQVEGIKGKEDWSVVRLKEERCTFTLDFQKVYWNSRLAGEHRRMVREIQKDAARRQAIARSRGQQQQSQPLVVADLMAGVGPFAIPLTAPATTTAVKQKNSKKGPQQTEKKKKDKNDISSGNHHTCNVRVYANDLNPDSYKFLKINAQQNKCREGQDLFCYNQCARSMLRQLQADGIVIDHVLMNLPASAPEFLDAFRGYQLPPPIENNIKESKPSSSSSEQTESSSSRLPRIHVYCFAPKPVSQLQEQAKLAAQQQQQQKQTLEVGDSKPARRSSVSSMATTSTIHADNVHDYQESLERCAKALGIESLDRQTDNVSVHVVRDVSPQKNMICVSFQLPVEVTTLPRIAITSPVAAAGETTKAVAADSSSRSNEDKDDPTSSIRDNNPKEQSQQEALPDKRTLADLDTKVASQEREVELDSKKRPKVS